jgi:hypothetical protein
MNGTLTNGERNLILSGLGLLLLEARKPGGKEYVADPDEVRALMDKVQHGKVATRKPHVSVDQDTLGRYVEFEGAARLATIAEAHDISRTQARRKLDGLVHQGRLVKHGEDVYSTPMR